MKKKEEKEKNKKKKRRKKPTQFSTGRNRRPKRVKE